MEEKNVKKQEKEVSEQKSIQDELNIVDGNVSSKEFFVCKSCDKTFAYKSEMQKHIQRCHQEMKIKLLLMQKKIADQKAHVATSLVNLKQIEASQNLEPCICRGFCRIYHKKHNWILPQSDVIYKQLESLS